MSTVLEDAERGSLLPHDIQAEMAVLGAMMMTEAALTHCLDVLTPDAFYRPAHQLIFEACGSLALAGKPVDWLTVKAELERQRQIAQAGGAMYLNDCLHAVPAAVNAGYYADKMLSCKAQRDFEMAAERIRQIAREPEMTAGQRAEAAFAALDAVQVAATAERSAVTAADLFTQSIERIEAGRAPGVVELPWADMRLLIPYLRPGQLVTVAARPSLGKSVVGQDIARHVAMDQGLAVILFTMEMDRDEVMDRLISAEAGVLLDRLIAGTLEPDEWDRIARVQGRFTETTLVIDDTPSITLAHIRSRLRVMSRRTPAQVAIVDYLQLMKAVAQDSRQREVSELVSGLKDIAREFRIPVVMLCQLNRGPEARHDKRPYLSDARESGAVENDSDIAILIHRPDHYDSQSARPGEADLIVDKNRNGPRSTVTVGFQGHYARFVDLSRLDWSSAPAPDWGTS